MVVVDVAVVVVLDVSVVVVVPVLVVVVVVSISTVTITVSVPVFPTLSVNTTVKMKVPRDSGFRSTVLTSPVPVQSPVSHRLPFL